MNRTSELISAVMTLALGILFVILKANVIGICLAILGLALIISAIIDLVRKSITTGVIKAVLGVAVWIVGGLLLEVALIILGIVLLIFGVLELIKRLTASKQELPLWAWILGLIEPVICVIASIFLITSGGAALNWAVIVGGVCLIVDGILALIAALGARK